MSKTLRHIIADIRNIATSGSNPVEFKIEDSQIAFWINQCRSTLISQALAKRQDINDIWVQKLSCLELEKTDEGKCWDSEDEECKGGSGCYIYRTKDEIPDTIESTVNNMIIRVTTLYDKVIGEGNIFSKTYISYNKYTGDKATWWLENKHIKIKSLQPLGKINVYLIADDPEDLSGFFDCDNNECWTYDSTYPVTLKMASIITDIVIRTKVYPYLQLPADHKNDADSSPDTQLPKKI